MDDSPTRSDTFIFGHPKASDANSFQVVRPINLKTGFWKILNFFIKHKHHAKRAYAGSSQPPNLTSSNPDLISDHKTKTEYDGLCLITDELDEQQSLHMEHEKGNDDDDSPDEDKSKSEVSKSFFQKVNLEGLMKLFAELHKKKRARELAKKEDVAKAESQDSQQEKSSQADRVERYLKLSTTLALLKETTISRASSASILEAATCMQTPTNSPRKNAQKDPAELLDDCTLNLLESVRNKLADYLIAEECGNSLQATCNDSTHYNNLCDEDWSTKVATTLDYDTSCEDVSSLKNNSLLDLDEAFLQDTIDSEIIPPLVDCQDDEAPVFSDTIDLDKNIDTMIAQSIKGSEEQLTQDNFTTQQKNSDDPKQNLSCSDVGNPPNLGDFSYVEISNVGQNIVNCDLRKEEFLDAIEELSSVEEKNAVKEMIYNHINDAIDQFFLDKEQDTQTSVSDTISNVNTMERNSTLNLNFTKDETLDNTLVDTIDIDDDTEDMTAADLTTINENAEEDDTTNCDDAEEEANLGSHAEFVSIDDLIANFKEKVLPDDNEESSDNIEEECIVTVQDIDDVGECNASSNIAEEDVSNCDDDTEEAKFVSVDELIANFKAKTMPDEESSDTSECRIAEVEETTQEIEEAAVYNIEEASSNIEEHVGDVGSFKIEDVTSLDGNVEDLIDFNDSGINLDPNTVNTAGDHLSSILDKSNEDLINSFISHTPQSAYAIVEEDIKTMIKELLFETEEIKETVIASSSHNLTGKSSFCQGIIEEIVDGIPLYEAHHILDAVIDRVCNTIETKNHSNKIVSVNYCFVQTHMEKIKKYPESKIVRANKAFRTLYKVKNPCGIQTGPRVTVVNLTPASQNRCFFRSDDKLTNRIRRSAALLMALYEEMRDYSYYSCTSNILCDLYESMCRNERFLPEISKRLELGQEAFMTQHHGNNVFVVNATNETGSDDKMLGDPPPKTSGSTSSNSYTTCKSVKYAESLTSVFSDSDEELPVSDILPNLKYTYCSQEEINSAVELSFIEENVKANEGKDLGLDAMDVDSSSSDSLRTDIDINETECFIRVDDTAAN